MSFSSSVLQFFFGFLCIYFINVRFKMIKNYAFVMFVNDFTPSFANIFAVKFFRLVYVVLNAAARNVIVDSLDDVTKNPIQMPSLSIDSENDKRMSSSSSTSMVRRRVRTRAERGRIWSISRFGSFSLGSMMILAIVVFSWVFAVGECINDPSRQRRQIDRVTVADIEFFDMYAVRRGAAMMGGSIKYTLAFLCGDGESFKLLTEDRKERGAGTCGHGGHNHIVQFNITDDLPIGKFIVKINETIYDAFPSLIHYVLVNRPLNVKECNASEVYAKIADGTKCTKLDQTWCVQHYGASSKVGCPAANDMDWKSWCYGVGDIAKMPTSETARTPGCRPGSEEYHNPYVANKTLARFRNDGWINMTKETEKAFLTFFPTGQSAIIINTTYYFDDEIVWNTTIAQGTFHEVDELPSKFFANPGKVTRLTKVTVEGQGVRREYFIRLDLFNLETDMKVNISATCSMKSGNCKYEATGELAEFCKQRMPTMVCGMKFGEQYHEGLVVFNIGVTGEVPLNTTFFYGWYPWDGQKFIHGITAEMTPNMIVDIETTTTGDGGWSTGDGGEDDGGSGSTPPRNDSSTSKRVTNGTHWPPPPPPEEVPWWIYVIVVGVIVLAIICAICIAIWFVYKKYKEPAQKVLPSTTVVIPAEKIPNLLKPECKKRQAESVNDKKIDEEKQKDHGLEIVKVLMAKPRQDARGHVEGKDKRLIYDAHAPSIPVLMKTQVAKLHANCFEDSFGFIHILSQAPTPEEMPSFWNELYVNKVGVLVVSGPFTTLDHYDPNKIDPAFPKGPGAFNFVDKATGAKFTVTTEQMSGLIGDIIWRKVTWSKQDKHGKIEWESQIQV